MGIMVKYFGYFIYTSCGNYYGYLCLYIVMNDYLCVYIVMCDYLCLFLINCDYVFLLHA